MNPPLDLSQWQHLLKPYIVQSQVIGTLTLTEATNSMCSPPVWSSTVCQLVPCSLVQ